MKQQLYYPVNLDIQGRKCLVVGGGNIAEHKARSLLECGAAVKVVSPVLGKRMAGLVQKKKVSYIKQKYQEKDLKGVFLVIAATNDLAVNTLVARHAKDRNILVNVVDIPRLCSFIIPSVIRRGPLVMGISTSGHSPMFAREMRKKCEQCFTPALGSFIRMMGEARKEVKDSCDSISVRKAKYLEMINSPMLSLLEKGKVREARQTLHNILEKGRDIK